MIAANHQENLEEIEASLADFKLTALLGPPGSGKTERIRALGVAAENYLDLEDPMVQARLETPDEVLRDLRGLVVIDGFQRRADLLPVLLDAAKAWGGPSRFLLSGTVAMEWMKGYDADLAAEVNVIRSGGLSCRDVANGDLERLWLRGGLPGSFTAESDEESARWREAYVQTFLRRDLVGVDVPPERLWRFWTETARRHGEVWNSSAVAAALSVSHPTARSYLNLLSGCFMLRLLRPMAGDGRKRLVKAPKVYVRDSGLLHGLLAITSIEDLQQSPWHEASWKGFVIEQLVAVLRLEDDEMFFWATHGGAGIDLVVERGGRRFGFECTLNETPRTTHSMTIAKADLGLESVYLVHPGKESFPLKDGIDVLGFEDLAKIELV